MFSRSCDHPPLDTPGHVYNAYSCQTRRAPLAPTSAPRVVSLLHVHSLRFNSASLARPRRPRATREMQLTPLAKLIIFASIHDNRSTANMCLFPAFIFTWSSSYRAARRELRDNTRSTSHEDDPKMNNNEHFFLSQHSCDGWITYIYRPCTRDMQAYIVYRGSQRPIHTSATAALFVSTPSCLSVVYVALFCTCTCCGGWSHLPSPSSAPCHTHAEFSVPDAAAGARARMPLLVPAPHAKVTRELQPQSGEVAKVVVHRGVRRHLPKPRCFDSWRVRYGHAIVVTGWRDLVGVPVLCALRRRGPVDAARARLVVAR